MANAKLLSAFNIRRYLIFLYGASTCFGTFALVGSSRNFTLSFILAVLYILSLAPFLKRLPVALYRYRRYVWLPVIFFSLLCVMNIFYANEYRVPIVSMPILSCLVMFVFMLLHSMYDTQALKIGLYGFVLGTIILSMLFMLGIGVYVETGIAIDEGERMSMFGQNQNALGLLMANGISLTMMIALFYDSLKLKGFRLVSIVPIVFMLSLLLAAASRAAFVSLILSFLIIILLHKTQNRFSRLLLFVVGLCGVWYGLQTMAESGSLMFERLMSTVEDGNTSGRADIWQALIPRLVEHPIFGVGQTGYAEVSHKVLVGVAGSMYEYGYSPHNVLIEVFAYTGLVGLFVMLLFWGRIGVTAWRSYKNNNNLVPLLLLIPILLSIMTGQVLADKVAWLSYAYIITRTHQNTHGSKRLNE